MHGKTISDRFEAVRRITKSKEALRINDISKEQEGRPAKTVKCLPSNIPSAHAVGIVRGLTDTTRIVTVETPEDRIEPLHINLTNILGSSIANRHFLRVIPPRRQMNRIRSYGRLPRYVECTGVD